MGLIDYKFVKGGEFPEYGEASLYSYYAFQDGIYLMANREEFGITFPIAACQIRGLRESRGPLFDFRLPLIPEGLIDQMLDEAISYAESSLETLFHFTWSPLCIYDEGWQKMVPEQERTPVTCRPLDDGPGSSHEKAIIEIHSHHGMAARFSRQDDADEQGFRVYGVIGCLDKEPEIRMRVGVYGYFWDIPASSVIELSGGLKDLVEGEQ